MPPVRIPLRSSLFQLASGFPAPLRAVCPELILMILRYCSPMDLVVLSQIAVFRCVLDQNRSCWAEARSTMSLPDPPFSMSEEEFARTLFEGGSCDACGIYTEEPMLSHALNIRCCSSCSSTALNYRTLPGLMTVSAAKIPKSAGTRWAPRESVKTGGSVFRQSDVKVLEECHRVLHESNSADNGDKEYVSELIYEEAKKSIILKIWQKQYLESKASFAARNLEFLKDVAVTVQVKRSKLLLSPTLKRVVAAFDRDLEEMRITDWSIIRPRVMAEIKTKRALPPSPPKVAKPLFLIGSRGCRICPEGSHARQMISPLTFSVHIQIMHPKNPSRRK
ncbi:hypothetical protein R3P38DRAFT_2899204 [Favolaschia claudopus]|uniref:F-box domain-containing protein n=1 Tax=Favolaschia claudopus TaxID=2862362 RepID=A0AAW0CLI4_9AGAR